MMAAQDNADMQLTNDWPGKKYFCDNKKRLNEHCTCTFFPIAHYYDSMVLSRRSDFFACCCLQYHQHQLFRCCLVIFIRSFSTKPIKEMCSQYKKRCQANFVATFVIYIRDERQIKVSTFYSMRECTFACKSSNETEHWIFCELISMQIVVFLA